MFLCSMMYYCIGINTIILLSVSQFASDASFWCYININELYIKKPLCSTLIRSDFWGLMLAFYLRLLWSNYSVTHYLLVAFANNFCKQFGPRSGPTECGAWSGSNLFDAQMVFLKEFFEKADFEKNQQTAKKREKLPRRQRVTCTSLRVNSCNSQVRQISGVQFCYFLCNSLCCGGVLIGLACHQDPSFQWSNHSWGKKRKIVPISVEKKGLPISDCLQTQKSRTDQSLGDLFFYNFVVFPTKN